MAPAFMIAAAAGMTTAAALTRGELPAPRVYVGAFVAGTALLFLAQSQPELAGKFAGLVLTTSLLTSGYDVATGVNKALTRK